jgi:single-strand DNA-binding protein
MYQNTVVIGNLGDDPKMKYTQTGQAVTEFRMATNRKWKGADGETKEKTTWFRVSAWGKLAELCNQYLAKGRLVLVEGEIDASAWVGQDGQPRASLELRARNVQFLGGRGTPGEGGERGPASAEDEGDIPF